MAGYQQGQAVMGAPAWGFTTPNPKLKLLNQVREVMRLKHYSLRTEPRYCNWSRRYVHFHHPRSCEELLAAPARHLEAFLGSLSVQGHVAASTQAFTA